ncbi:MAG: cbb3-type cytochrome c oxidase subunit 3 [Yoonia sp.]|nr:cbb3-type cytochrome c oxidase subunit 3 [Yoonia sp.]
MDTYSFLRELADSWVLLLMTAFFGGAIAWAFRPGSRAIHEDIANIPFRNDTAKTACKNDCAGCICASAQDNKGADHDQT